MNFSQTSKKIIFFCGLITMAALFSRCSATSTSGSGSTTELTTGQKITTALGSAVSSLQGVGSSIAGSGSLSVGGNHMASAATNCTSHGDPGSDLNSDGSVDESEKFSQSDVKFALGKFYCALAAETSGPESVAGAVSMIKTVACAVDRQITGGVTFDNTPVSLTTITIDTNCATAQKLVDMGGTSTSVTLSLPVTITAAKNPSGSNFPEASANTNFTHGLRIASSGDSGAALTYVILAKFDDTLPGDPLDNGDFEFATYGSGTQMQGTAVEYTAGKIDRTTGTDTAALWYEQRINRIKSSTSDAVCQPGDPAASSCGFARHTRLRADVTFTGGDISDVSNITGVISDGGDSTGSAQMNNSNLVTATGSLSTELTGKIYSLTASPTSLGSSDTISALTTVGTTSCILAGGSIVAVGCGSPLSPSGSTLKQFFMPENNSTWFASLSASNGIGFTGAATLADSQFAP